MAPATIRIAMPDWLSDAIRNTPACPDDELKMQAVIGLAQRNLERDTGGPFAAGIFDLRTHRMIAAGVNVVVPTHLSCAHAEITALSLAQQQLGNHDLAAIGDFALASSTEPCAMCCGALPWSGIRRLICGATSADACAIGFDEGPRHPDWIAELTRRGITIATEVCRHEARAILQRYVQRGGPIYNGSAGARTP
ncbi:MAG: nucleoside deaminase [Zetaproteobacteria bacterium]|nr:MAG: nucleoside deaminase [Zetaproteobacteria bacterium]